MKHNILVQEFHEDMVNMRPDFSGSSEWWNKWRQQLRDCALHEDPNRFVTWGPIMITMYCHNTEYAVHEVSFLKTLPDWEQRWRPALKERGEFEMGACLAHPESNATTVHHAFHVAMFEKETGVKISDMDFIFEFGGGFGDMCRLIHRLGFSGRYVIHDLPEFLALQRFFLKASGVAVESGRVELVPDFSSVAALVPKSGKRCVASTWAIEESTPKVMSDFVDMMPLFDHFLFAGGDGCFSRIQREQIEVDWKRWEIPFLKGNMYMMGKRR